MATQSLEVLFENEREFSFEFRLHKTFFRSHSCLTFFRFQFNIYFTITKVAEILNYSQSGISHMINDLEKEWKVVLLERGKSGVRLTSDGTKLLPYAQNVCIEYEKMQMKVDELNGLQSGLIRIGTFSSVATHWLPNIIKNFQRSYPGIDYELLLGDYTEISEIFERYNLTPKIHFTTWDDYAIMSMVESGLGISILPELILKRVPYRIIAKELDVPAYRKIGIALRSKKNASLAVKRFLDYMQYR